MEFNSGKYLRLNHLGTFEFPCLSSHMMSTGNSTYMYDCDFLGTDKKSNFCTRISDFPCKLYISGSSVIRTPVASSSISARYCSVVDFCRRIIMSIGDYPLRCTRSKCLGTFKCMNYSLHPETDNYESI